MANGTAISYTPITGHEGRGAWVDENITKTITMENNSQYVGTRVQDTLCLDDNDDICVMHFGFYDVTNSKAITDKTQDGVVNLNNYGFKYD